MAENKLPTSGWPLAALGTSGPIVVVLALLALVSVYAPPRSEPAKGTTVQVPTSEQGAGALAASAQGALGPLYDYLLVHGPDEGRQKPVGLDQLLSGYHVEVMIATLPDPKRTRVATMFDTMLEAIRRAVESDDYVLDQFHLPWAEPEPASTGAPASAPAGSWRLTIEHRDGAGTTDRAGQPGSILFRHASNDALLQKTKPLRLLLLVGETPTVGVDKDSLWTALNIAGRLGQYREDPSRGLCVIGPTFSGSAASLARTLKEWDQSQPQAPGGAKRPEFWVCTGSATNVTKAAFENAVGKGRARFTATVIPDGLVFDQVVAWLQSKNRGFKADSEPVALLTESGTAYSGWARRPEEKNRLIIPFPLHISQMRGSGADKERDPIVAQQRGHVAIPIDDVPEAHDQVPSLTPKMTTASDSLIMANILATIAREEVRYVGIVATDPLDILFLTGLIREHCPDVQVILIGADLRYTDPEFTLDFRGAIIASSYPLDAFAQNWSYPANGRRRRLLFVSDADMGCYNATLVLLKAGPKNSSELSITADDAENFLAYGPPLFRADELQKESRPAIWINQVGQSNLWPLQAVPLDGLKNGDAPAISLIPALKTRKLAGQDYASFGLNFPMFFKFAAMGTSVLGILLGLLWVWPPVDEANIPGRFVRSWVRAKDDESPAARWCIISIAASIIVPSGLMLRAGIILNHGEVLSDHFWDRVATGFILTLLGLNLLVMLVVSLGALRRQLPYRRANWRNLVESANGRIARGLIVTQLGLQILIVVSMIVFAGRCVFSGSDQNERVLFALRDVSLTSGVSPILSVLVLGACSLSLGFLELRWLDLRQRVRKAPSLDAAALARHGSFGKRLQRILDGSERGILSTKPFVTGLKSRRSWAWIGIVAAILVVAFLVLAFIEIHHRSVSTLEYPWYNLAFIVILGVNMGILAWFLARFVILAVELLSLFGEVARLPLGAALHGLPERARLVFGRFVRTYSDLDADREMLKQATGQLPEVDAGPAGPVHRLEKALPELLGYWHTLPLSRAFGSARPGGEPQAGSGGERTSDTGSRRFEDVSESSQAGSGGERTSDADDTRRRMDAVEDALSLFLVRRLRPYALAVRWLAHELTIGPVLLLVAATCFPFEPQQFTATLLWAFIVVALATNLTIYVLVDRDQFVSWVSHTKPNELSKDWEFMSNILVRLIPALTVFLVAFPGVWYWLRSVLGPLSRSLK
ncbi:MAG: hypothetical protein ACLQVF_15795 [Isosphaeraceae bacterium]